LFGEEKQKTEQNTNDPLIIAQPITVAGDVRCEPIHLPAGKSSATVP